MDYNYSYTGTPELGFPTYWTDEPSIPIQERCVVLEVASVPVQEIQVIQQEVPSTGSEFDRLEWSTCDYDSSGCPIGFDGKTWGQYQVVKL
jgi:hypothetical protein